MASVGTSPCSNSFPEKTWGFTDAGCPIWIGELREFMGGCSRDVINDTLRVASRVATEGVSEAEAAKGLRLILGKRRLLLQPGLLGQLGKYNKYHAQSITIHDVVHSVEAQRFVYPDFSNEGAMIIDWDSGEILGQGFTVASNLANCNADLSKDTQAASALAQYGPCFVIRCHQDSCGVNGTAQGNFEVFPGISECVQIPTKRFNSTSAVAVPISKARSAENLQSKDMIKGDATNQKEKGRRSSAVAAVEAAVAVEASATATVLQGQRLASILHQASRSIMVRVVNLTRQDLVLDGEASILENCNGFWIAHPTQRIPSMSVNDIGMAGQGLFLGIQGELAYMLAAPKSKEEERVSIRIAWRNPWLGTRMLEASEEQSRLLVVESHVDGRRNLIGAVHVIDPRSLPRLEVIEAAALCGDSRGAWTRSEHGPDLTRQLKHHLTSPHELSIPNVRSFLAGVALDDNQGDSRMRADKGVQSYIAIVVRYQIGPEVFERVFQANERVHISTAVSGGEDVVATVLNGLQTDASVAVSIERPRAPRMSRAERMLFLQRTLCGALSVELCKALRGTYGDDWLSPEHSAGLGLKLAGCFWPASGSNSVSGSSTAFEAVAGEVELDAEGLLVVLRFLWPRHPVLASAGSPEELLPPLEAVATAWAEQADIAEASVQKAVAAGAIILRSFDLDTQANLLEGCYPRRQALKSSFRITTDATAKLAESSRMASASLSRGPASETVTTMSRTESQPVKRRVRMSSTDFSIVPRREAGTDIREDSRSSSTGTLMRARTHAS